jgi:hypothetical protein
VTVREKSPPPPPPPPLLLLLLLLLPPMHSNVTTTLLAGPAPDTAAQKARIFHRPAQHSLHSPSMNRLKAAVSGALQSAAAKVHPRARSLNNCNTLVRTSFVPLRSTTSR